MLILELSQIALEADSIDEQLVYQKIIDYSKYQKIALFISFKGYQPFSKVIDVQTLSSARGRALIIPLNKMKQLNEAEQARREKESFVFVGSISEKGTKIRLPNVRLILRDRKVTDKRFAQITDAYGTFRDTIFGYKLNTLLSFDVYLKKEGYISKFVLFEETLEEYGEIDLEEYLEKINLTKAAVGVEIGKAANINPIYFDLDRSTIRPDAALELDKVVQVMNDLPKVSVELSSHTDARGTDRYNLALSQRRANATTNYLISKGIDPERIVSVGYGESQLVNGCSNGLDCTEEQHALNRRTEFEITDMGDAPKGESQAKLEASKKGESKDKSPQNTVKSTKDEKIRGIKGSSLVEKEKRKRFARIKTINVICSVTEAETGEPLAGVEVVASDVLDPRNTYTTKSNENGEFSLRIQDYEMGDKVYLDFLLSKEGFISKTYDYRGKIDEDFKALIKLNTFFEDINLVAADLDVDIRKAANIPNIEFEVDEAKISRKAAVQLDKIAAILVEQPSLNVEIRSHTDSRATKAYNLKLSKERAKATMNYLVAQGVSYSRITAKGFGEQKLLNHCSDGVECSEAEHEENRRMEFIIR